MGTDLHLGLDSGEFSQKIDKLNQLVDLARKLFPAYEVYSSAGSTNAAFERHIWPLIRDIRKLLGPSVAYAAGYRDTNDGSYGMFAGPCPTYEEIVEYEPDDLTRSAFIFRFEGKKDTIVARWDQKRCKWRRID